MKRLWRTAEVLAWATFFAFAAAVLGLRYGLLPQIERYRPEIVARVAATVGQPVKIGKIEAEWLGLRPQINLSDVRIYDAEGREALVLPSVENILSWRSVAHGQLRLHALRIEGPRLVVRRDSAGAFYVAGMKLSPAAGESGISDWLLDQKEIEIRNAEIEWRDEKRAAAPLTLSAINLRLENQGERHSIGLAGRLPEALGTSLQLRAELVGGSLAQASGQIYAELGYTDLAAWRPWFDYPIELQHGQGAVRLWTTVEGGVARQATADLALAGVSAKLGDELPPLELGSINGRLQARLLADGYQLTARSLALAPPGAPALAPVDFQLAWKAESGVASANTLELAPLAHFAEALPLPADVRKLALELEPRGQLGDLRFEWQGAIAAPAQYRARARFFDLGLKPRETLPGFARLAGTIEATEAGGRLYLQSRGAQIELPRVFPEPRLAFDTLDGQLDWRREGGALNVQVASITFSNADLSGNAFGGYAYDGEGPGTIDVSAVLNRADAKNLPHYLPLGALMGEKPREWLVKGILAGEASDVQVRLQGDLREFPFTDPARGRFLVTARVHHGLLHYADGWPRIEDIEAELAFDRTRMDLIGRGGRVLGASLHDVKVSIADLGRASHVLVSGQAQGPTAEFLKFIQSSPLRASAGRFTQGMSATGDGRLQLKLDLPLADLGASRVAGEYELVANQIVLHPVLPPLEQARGRVAFTESSFAVRDARGQIFGGPVSIRGGTRAGGNVEFVARGEAQPAALGALFDHPLRRFLTGSSLYIASISLRDGLQRVVVDSSLRGVASALPPPLEKPAADALPLHVEFVPADGGARERISISLARVLAAEIQRRREGEEMQVQRAALWFTPAGQSIRLPERPGVLVYGSVAALDADRWRAVLPAGGAGALPTTVELRLGRFDVYGKRVHNLALRGAADAGGWSAVVDADEIAGQLTYKAEGAGQLVARLLHFTVPRIVAEDGKAPTSRPADLPAIDFSAERFNLRGKQLGRVELGAQRDGDDWRIDKLAMTNPDATLSASGRWRGGAAPASELDFKLAASDVGKFLARVGYPDTVLGGKAELGGSVRWLGEPMTLDYSSLSGDLKLGAEDGQFLEIDPGLGKLISLMNLQALPRRIALDFRDVFSKGFRFDRIDAVSHVEHGTMQLSEFRMSGPAAEVAMSGQVDLAHETQDLKLRVVPSLGGTASTAVAIVNPLAGVAAAIAQRVLRNPLGQIFAHEFEVTGSWVDPKVAKVAVQPAPNETVTP